MKTDVGKGHGNSDFGGTYLIDHIYWGIYVFSHSVITHPNPINFVMNV